MSDVIANEQQFQSIYLDPTAEDWKQRIVFHDPIFKHETPGIVALKSLRLEDTYGLVAGGPKGALLKFREYIQDLDSKEKLGDIEDLGGLLDRLEQETEKVGLSLIYIQKGKEVQSSFHIEVKRANKRLAAKRVAAKPKIISLNLYDVSEDDEDLEELRASLIDFEKETSGLRIMSNQEPILGHAVGNRIISALWSSPDGHISFAVHPEYQRQGLAKELIRSHIADCKDTSLEEITAEPIHEVSSKILESLGFVKDPNTPKIFKLSLSQASIEAQVPNLSQEFELWTPTQVHKKLPRVIQLVNDCMPTGVFLQETKEGEDDVPIVRLLLGPRDPYTAERIGSLAFFSTQRGMEWYTKLFGETDFQPGLGMVFVTYYDDVEHKEEPVLKLLLGQDDAYWALEILNAFGLAKLPCGCLHDCKCGCVDGSICPCKSVSPVLASAALYHGSPKSGLKQLEVIKDPKRNPVEGHGIYLTESPEVAKDYAAGTGSVYEVTLNPDASVFEGEKPGPYIKTLKLVSDALDLGVDLYKVKHVPQVISALVEGRGSLTGFGRSIRIVLENDEQSDSILERKGQDSNLWLKLEGMIDSSIESYAIIRYRDQSIDHGKTLVYVVRGPDLITIKKETKVTGAKVNVTAAIANFRSRQSVIHPDPALVSLILSHNCFWVPVDSNKVLSSRPSFITPQFLVYKAGSSVTASFFDESTKRGIVEKGPAFFDPSLPTLEKVEEITKEKDNKQESATMDAILGRISLDKQIISRELSKYGKFSRSVLKEVLSFDNNYYLVLEYHTKEIPDFTLKACSATASVVSLPEAILATLKLSKIEALRLTGVSDDQMVSALTKVMYKWFKIGTLSTLSSPSNTSSDKKILMERQYPDLGSYFIPGRPILTGTSYPCQDSQVPENFKLDERSAYLYARR